MINWQADYLQYLTDSFGKTRAKKIYYELDAFLQKDFEKQVFLSKLTDKPICMVSFETTGQVLSDEIKTKIWLACYSYDDKWGFGWRAVELLDHAAINNKLVKVKCIDENWAIGLCNDLMEFEILAQIGCV